MFQGGRDVLRLYGYTEERPDGLSFPEGQEEPDEYQVAIVTLEVLLLRTELSLLLQVRWCSDSKVLDWEPNLGTLKTPCWGILLLQHSGSFSYAFSLLMLGGRGLQELCSRWEFS